MRRELTASGLDLADVCLGSAVLDQVDEPSEDADAGRAFHAFLETARAKGRDVALAEAPDDEREAFAVLDLEALPPGAESEVALGWDPSTGRAVRYDNLGEHRAYPNDGLLHGTTDLIGVRVVGSARTVVVVDYKRFQIRTSAADSLQLATYILAVAALVAADGAEGALIVPRSDGRWYRDRAVFDAIDLEAMADRIRGLLAEVAAARRAYDVAGRLPELAVGNHCKICRARRLCPALEQPLALAARAQLEALAAEELPSPEALSRRITALAPEAKGRLYDRLKTVEAFVKLALETVRADAERAAIPLPDGKELRAIPWTQWKKSPAAEQRLESVTKELKDAGEIYPVKVPQVRPANAPSTAKAPTKRRTRKPKATEQGATTSAAEAPPQER